MTIELGLTLVAFKVWLHGWAKGMERDKSNDL